MRVRYLFMVLALLFLPRAAVAADVAVLYDYSGSMKIPIIEKCREDIINLILNGDGDEFRPSVMEVPSKSQDEGLQGLLDGTPLVNEGDTVLIMGFSDTQFPQRLLLAGTDTESYKLFPYTDDGFEKAVRGLYPTSGRIVYPGETDWELSQTFAIRTIYEVSKNKGPIYIFMFSDFVAQVFPRKDPTNFELMSVVKTTFTIEDIYFMKLPASENADAYLRVFKATRRTPGPGGAIKIASREPEDRKAFDSKQSVTFKWDATNISLFNLTVTETGKKEPDYGKKNLNKNEMTITDLPDGSYEWFVSSYIDTSTRSQTRTFTMGKGCGDIMLISPTNDTEYDKDEAIDLSWTAAVPANTEFAVTVWKVTGKNTTIVYTTKTSKKSATIPDVDRDEMGSGTFQWQVYGCNKSSEKRTFTVESPIGGWFILMLLALVAIGGGVYWAVSSGKFDEIRKRLAGSDKIDDGDYRDWD